jgi:CubicO group peptidase (beta-lactamase class C family)/Flp pilus assembly protein TadD
MHDVGLIDGDVDSLASRLEDAIPELLEKANIPGLSVALIKDGETLWRRGFGVKNALTGKPVLEDTVFEAASFTKPFFAYLVMKMVEGGEIDLDRPLVEYVPEDYVEKVYLAHPLDAEGFRGDWFRRITARMVLSHSSGLPHAPYDGPVPIHFEPGTQYKYSANGYMYLQRIVERLRGEPLEETMRREVLEPLGMGDSSMVWRGEYEEKAAVGHDILGRTDGEHRRRVLAVSAASLYTTAGDYARFVSAVMNGEGLEEETVAEMLGPQVDVDEGVRWSLGFGLEDSGQGEAFWQWGDYGIFRNYVRAHRERGIGVVYLTNSFNGLSIGPEMMDLVFGDGDDPALRWLDYEHYGSPRYRFLDKLVDGGLQEAAEFYREAREKHPDDFSEEGMSILGRRVFGSGNSDEAVFVYRLNAESHPGSPEAHINLGEAYVTAGRDDLAAESFNRAMELEPGNKSARRNLAMLELVRVAKEDVGRALSIYRALRAERPEDHTEGTLSGFGRTLLSGKRLQEAAGVLKVGVKAYPDSSDAHLNLAQAQKMRGRREDALESCRRALKLNQYNWVAIFLLKSIERGL